MEGLCKIIGTPAYVMSPKFALIKLADTSMVLALALLLSSL